MAAGNAGRTALSAIINHCGEDEIRLFRVHAPARIITNQSSDSNTVAGRRHGKSLGCRHDAARTLRGEVQPLQCRLPGARLRGQRLDVQPGFEGRSLEGANADRVRIKIEQGKAARRTLVVTDQRARPTTEAGLTDIGYVLVIARVEGVVMSAWPQVHLMLAQQRL